MIAIPKKIIKITLLVAVLLVSSLAISNSTTRDASAVSASSWSAGRIISDTLFYDNNSMSLNDIQNFLNSRVQNCDTNGTQSAAAVGYPNLTNAQYATQVRGWQGPPYVCLKDYMQVPDSTQIISNFQGSTPAGAISAAQIIKNAADTHGVSPKALLVLLQKESLNLIYDSWPMLSQYRNSMGYACPDGGVPCNPQFAGFFNQMNNAARQLKLYKTNASAYRYKPFQTNLISYQADAPSCGASNVYIENYATAGLYNYTPYQPNAAALQNLYGTGDSCSAYGNRNFWRLYNDWFGSTEYETALLSYKSHVAYSGWTNSTINDGTTGAIGKKTSIEAFRISGEVEYSSYSAQSGWQPTVGGDMISGTTDQKKPLQAIRIQPNKTLATKYDIYYRTHVSYIGWTGWAKNGDISGSTGDVNRNIEAFDVVLVPKGLSAPGSTANAYYNGGTPAINTPLNVSVTSHVGGMGWQPTVTGGMVSGLTEHSKPVEAIKFSLSNQTGLAGNILYSSQLAYTGWEELKANGEQSGTTGEFRSVEAIRLALTGELGSQYDVWYRTYVQYQGWLGWAKNGNPAGSVGASSQLEAVEVRILPKNSSDLKQTNSLHNPGSQALPDDYSISYSSQVSYVGWTPMTTQNSVSGSIGNSQSIETLRFGFARSFQGNLDLTCSAYVKDQGWVNDVPAGSNCGTIGQTKPLEAIKLKLTGSAASKYDLYYRVHLAWLGWQGWVKADTVTGNVGANQPIEAISVKLVKK